MNSICRYQIGAFGPNTRRLPLRVNNVARRLNRPERTIRHWAKTGRLRAFKIDGKSWAFWPADVDLFLLVQGEVAHAY
jgi:excisionase family DNA binding protein